MSMLWPGQKWLQHWMYVLWWSPQNIGLYSEILPITKGFPQLQDWVTSVIQQGTCWTDWIYHHAFSNAISQQLYKVHRLMTSFTKRESVEQTDFHSKSTVNVQDSVIFVCGTLSFCVCVYVCVCWIYVCVCICIWMQSCRYTYAKCQLCTGRMDINFEQLGSHSFQTRSSKHSTK